MSADRGQRLTLFSRYQLSDQYDLAAEFRPMLAHLCRDYAVQHVSFRNTRPPDNVPDGCTLTELPLSVDRKRPGDVIGKALLLYALLPLAAIRVRRFKPDLIFVTEILPLYALVLKWLTGRRVATAYGDWHVHNFLGAKWWVKPFLRLIEALERVEARHVDGLFCRAGAAGERLQSWGVDGDRIRVVFDAPDLSAFYPQNQQALRAHCGFTPDDVVLLYHGVMHQGKGLDQLLDYTADCYRAHPGIGLIMVGSGPEQESLRARAVALQIAHRVHFTGWLGTVEEVGHYCNAADICIAMRTGAESNQHIIPGALLHSMACRKVVIGPDLPGLREVIVPGENGYLFAPDNGPAFVSLIQDLIARRADWPRVADRAEHDIRERFSVEAAATAYADALHHFAGEEK